jgi:hypothetical protein
MSRLAPWGGGGGAGVMLFRSSREDLKSTTPSLTRTTNPKNQPIDPECERRPISRRPL